MGIRSNLGIKILQDHRPRPAQEAYNRTFALEKAPSSSGNFMFNRER